MPLALSPKMTVDVCLETDKAKPETERPVFVFRFLTCRQVLELADLIEAAEKAEGRHVVNDALTKALAVGLVDWRGIEKPFSLNEIDGVLTPSEKWELAYKSIREIQMKESDLKKSASQSGSNTAMSTGTPAANA